jgi:hypothetical protein
MREGGREVWEGGRERERNVEKRKRGGYKTKEQEVIGMKNEGTNDQRGALI